MIPTISIVIPVRAGESADIALKSLDQQTFRDFEIIIQNDFECRGACWARNRGAEMASAPLILFSDDDIQWEPYGIEALKSAIDRNPLASYSYGTYTCGARRNSWQEFDPIKLRRQNFVNSMALVRREHHPGWPEHIGRLQDWWVALEMLKHGHFGVHCGREIFRTAIRKGITYGGIPYDAAAQIVRAEQGL